MPSALRCAPGGQVHSCPGPGQVPGRHSAVVQQARLGMHSLNLTPLKVVWHSLKPAGEAGQWMEPA